MLKVGKLGFDNSNWPKGVWGKFAEGVEVKVRKLTNEAVRELRKPFMKAEMTLNTSNRRMEAVEHIGDPEKYDDALTDYLIEDFTGIGDDEGNPLPVNLESKKRIMNHLALRDWVWAFAQSVEASVHEKSEEARGN
jgi:hypothetical protein